MNVLSKEIREAIAATVRGELSWNVPMKERTTIRVGGPADALFRPLDGADAAAFVQMARRLKIPYDVVGAGSNLIVRDGGYRGVLIDVGAFDRLERQDETRVRAGAGVPLPSLVARAREWGMAGCERMCGIPGQVGGALAMNAGTHDGDTESVVESIDVVDRNGRLVTHARSEIPYVYRSWGLDRGTVALEAVFRFRPGDPREIGRRVDESKSKRKATQPLDLPNAGCAFKNVRDPKSGKTTMSVGRVIDELGLKGVRLRGAQISELHGNFIVNVGGATAKDVLGLVALVKDKVREAHGVTLESEWRILGEELADSGST